MTVLSLVLCASVVDTVSAYSYYQSSIPNGGNVKRDGQAWGGVGHADSFGGGYGKPLNPFGYAFKSAGKQWTKALCEADSDNDGQTNGFELGDPDCTWTAGSMPSRSDFISHPGFADSLSAAPISAPSTQAPTSPPTPAPVPPSTQAPMLAPTSAPTASPTSAPRAAPTATPTAAPTAAPVASPAAPTAAPTPPPFLAPTASPTPASAASPTPAPAATLAPTPAEVIPTPAPSPAPTSSVSVVMMVEGLDYESLIANSALQSAFVDQIQASIADAADVAELAVGVVLSQGSVVVTASIQTSFDQFDALVSRLSENSTQSTLAAEVSQRASGVPHIDLVTNDVISVTVDAIITPAPVPSPMPMSSPTPTPSGDDMSWELEPDADVATSAIFAGPVLLACLVGMVGGEGGL